MNTTNWLDRSIGYVAPNWALQRQRARIAGALLERHYEAAAGGRRTQGWKKSTGDANAVIGPAIATLRAVARDLARNNPHGKRGVKVIANHVVGWGIMPKAAPANPRANQVWKEWGETTACDADGRNDFYGLQKLALRTIAESGEIIIRRRFRLPEDNLPIPMQIQVFEGDYIDTARTYDLPNGGRILQGVEFDAIGRRVAYWLFAEHPGSAMPNKTAASYRVPAESVLHVYSMERPGQVRGTSWLAAAILKLKDFDEYDDAQLMKQKIAACLAVITSDVDGSGTSLGSVTNEAPLIDSLEPGMILNLPPGRNVEVVQPPRVSEFRDYAEVTLRTVAAGMDLTYEGLTGDYTNLPFSAARMSRLEHWDNVNDWRWQMLVPQMCDPVWAWAMEAALIFGRISGSAPKARWTAPPLPMLDPSNEGTAYQRNVRTGIMSLSEAIRERGYDPVELLDEMAADNATLDRLGLVLDSDPRKTTQQGMVQLADHPGQAYEAKPGAGAPPPADNTGGPSASASASPSASE